MNMIAGYGIAVVMMLICAAYWVYWGVGLWKRIRRGVTLVEAVKESGYSEQEIRLLIKHRLLRYRRRYLFFGPFVLDLEEIQTEGEALRKAVVESAAKEPLQMQNEEDIQDKTIDRARAEMIKRMLAMNNEELTEHMHRLAEMIMDAVKAGRPITPVVELYAPATVAPDIILMWQGALLRATLDGLHEHGLMKDVAYAEFTHFLETVKLTYSPSD